VPQGRDVVVVGASSGGVEALSRFVAKLPADLPATVLVVLHVPAASSSALPRILGRSAALPAAHAVHGEPLAPGRILVAPPDLHLLVEDGRVRLSRGPRENGHRPAIDPLFRSAARWYGPRVIAVVLSGSLDDGSAGLVTVHGHGGVTLVQDPDDAISPGMPLSAIAALTPDHVLAVDEMWSLVERLVAQPVPHTPVAASADLVAETRVAAMEIDALHRDDRPGQPAGLSCPDCAGALWEIEEGGLRRYRCRVGHAWSPDSLLAEQDNELESALWAALRSLEDKSALERRMAAGARAGGRQLSAARFEAQADEDEARAVLVRDLLVHGDGHEITRVLER